MTTLALDSPICSCGLTRNFAVLNKTCLLSFCDDADSLRAAGIPAEMPAELVPTEFPHWLTPMRHKQQYHSKSIIGKLHDEVLGFLNPQQQQPHRLNPQQQQLLHRKLPAPLKGARRAGPPPPPPPAPPQTKPQKPPKLVWKPRPSVPPGFETKAGSAAAVNVPGRFGKSNGFKKEQLNSFALLQDPDSEPSPSGSAQRSETDSPRTASDDAGEDEPPRNAEENEEAPALQSDAEEGEEEPALQSDAEDDEEAPALQSDAEDGDEESASPRDAEEGLPPPSLLSPDVLTRYKRAVRNEDDAMSVDSDDLEDLRRLSKESSRELLSGSASATPPASPREPANGPPSLGRVGLEDSDLSDAPPGFGAPARRTAPAHSAPNGSRTDSIASEVTDSRPHHRLPFPHHHSLPEETDASDTFVLDEDGTAMLNAHRKAPASAVDDRQRLPAGRSVPKAPQVKNARLKFLVEGHEEFLKSADKERRMYENDVMQIMHRYQVSELAHRCIVWKFIVNRVRLQASGMCRGKKQDECYVNRC